MIRIAIYTLRAPLKSFKKTMQENRYAGDHFSERYAQMERSQKGLADAGEWPTFKQLLPNFKGQDVLDFRLPTNSSVAKARRQLGVFNGGKTATKIYCLLNMQSAIVLNEHPQL